MIYKNGRRSRVERRRIDVAMRRRERRIEKNLQVFVWCSQQRNQRPQCDSNNSRGLVEKKNTVRSSQESRIYICNAGLGKQMIVSFNTHIGHHSLAINVQFVFQFFFRLAKCIFPKKKTACPTQCNWTDRNAGTGNEVKKGTHSRRWNCSEKWMSGCSAF